MCLFEGTFYLGSKGTKRQANFCFLLRLLFCFVAVFFGGGRGGGRGRPYADRLVPDWVQIFHRTALDFARESGSLAARASRGPLLAQEAFALGISAFVLDCPLPSPHFVTSHWRVAG